MVKVVGNADKQETGRWLNNRAENFKPMWQLLGSGYTGLPDERLDASSLGYRNAKKKVSNPLPGVARRERPVPAIGTKCDTILLLTKSGHSGVAQYVMAGSLVVAEAVRGACDEVIRL